MTTTANLLPGHADLVVIGAGGGGLCAAIAAAERGVQHIVVLEKRRAIGGNSATGGGPFAVKSPVQERAGLELDPENFIRQAMDWHRWRVNPRVVRAFVEKSGDTIGWLEQKGVRFPPPGMMVMYHVPVGEGRAMIEALRQTCTDRGIQILTETEGSRLRLDEGGRVCGVEATRDGQTVGIACSAAVVATGGYGANPDLLERYCVSYCDGMSYIGVPDLTGDGFTMSTAIGAAVDNAGTMLLEGPHIPTGVRLNIQTEAQGLVRVPMVALAWEPNLIWLNNRGERFVPENGGPFIGGNAVSRQPNCEAYVVFDRDSMERMINQGLLVGRPLPDVTREQQRGPLPGIDEELERYQAGGRVKIAGSLDELAEWIGARPEVLEATIDRFNADCERGSDTQFMKDDMYLVPVRRAPYYALKCDAVFLDTMGGLRIDEHMRVLDARWQPIPGLLAAGSVCGGLEDTTYCFLLLGSARGFALNSGRIAGETAADDLSTLGRTSDLRS